MAEKNVPSKETKEKKEPWSIKRIISTVIIAILALLMVGGAYYIVVLFQQGKTESDNLWGKYNGEPISLSMNTVFYNTLMSDSNFNVAYLSGDYNTMYTSFLNAYQQQVFYTALKQQGKKAGISATQDITDDIILKVGVYNDEDGNFSVDVYNNTSDSQKKFTNDFYKAYYPYLEVSSDISNVLISQDEIDFVVDYANKNRSFEYLVVDYNIYPDDLAKAEGEANPDLFKEIPLSVISTTDLESIELAKAELDAGHDWLDVVTAYSTDTFAQYGGEIGMIHAYALLVNFANKEEIDQVLTLEEGQYTQPIQSPYGYAIYKLTGTPAEADFTTEDSINAVKAYLAEEKPEVIKAYIDSVINEVTERAKADFTDASIVYGMATNYVRYACANIGGSSFINGLDAMDSEGHLAELVAADSNLSKELFTSEVGYVSDPIPHEDYYVIVKTVGADEESAMASILDTFYNYYATQFTVTDAANAALSSSKLEDNFYNQFLNFILGSY
ncbi:MAG: peptidylprolyl isomerase [Sphaerochaetaceae bacterium]|nr:peptidylprolyl isomerase [Sphaerochaetaceae bacterium]